MWILFQIIFFERSYILHIRPLKRYTSATFIQAKYTRVQLDVNARDPDEKRRKIKKRGGGKNSFDGERSIDKEEREGIAPSNNNGEISFEWKEEREASEEACRSAIPRARNVSWWTWRRIDNRSRATKARRT